MIVVAKNGSGNFTSIQAAVDSLPEAAGCSPSLVLIRAGEYREKVVIHRDHVRLVGEDPERTVLTWNGCAIDQYEDGTMKGTFLSSTLMTTGCKACAAYVMGLPEKPMESLILRDCRFTFDPDAEPLIPAMASDVEACCRRGIIAKYLKKLTLDRVRLTGCAGDPLETQEVGEVITT